MGKEINMDKALHKEYIQKYLESHKKIEPIKCPFCNEHFKCPFCGEDLIVIKNEMCDDSFGIICINDKCRSEWIDTEDIR